MEPASFHWEKIRISNFLSFYGNQEVKLSPFTAVTCCYSEGREDFLAAIEFVLGRNLKKIYNENPNKLFHRIFWKELETGSETECFVEITLKFATEKNIIKLYKGVKKCDFIYKIDDEFVTGFYYQEFLNTFNINAGKKNIILYKNVFDSMIWGPPEEFETFLGKLLGMDSRLEELTKMAEEARRRTRSSPFHLFGEKMKNIKKSHGIVDEFVRHFNSFLTRRDYFRGGSNDLSFTQIPEENGQTDVHDFQSLQIEFDSRLHIFNALQMEESKLLGRLYLCESKISPENENIIRERMAKLKSKLKDSEIAVSSLWAEMKKLEEELKIADGEIGVNLAILQDIQQSYYLQNRLTEYGRFIDYLEPFELVNLLKEIVGDSILYGNLCDDTETAKSCMEYLRAIKYETREPFIIFENYSSNFRDFLLGSGEKGIKINQIQELQIFLCKLKQYGVISNVPVISARGFDFESEDGEEEETKCRDVIYPSSGIFLRSDGTMSYAGQIRRDENLFDHAFTVKTVKQSLIRQEAMYEEYRDLIFQRQMTFLTVNAVENDIHYFKFHCKKRNRARANQNKISCKLSEIYDEFADHFKEHERFLEDAGKGCRLFGNFGFKFGSDESEIIGDSDGEHRLQMEEASQVLGRIENEKEKVKAELVNLRKKLRFAAAFSHEILFPPVKKFVLFQHPKKISDFYYELELKKLQSIMSKQEVEEFEGWKEWRKSTIDSLSENGADSAKSLKNSTKDLENLTREKEKILSPLLEHCNLNLSAAANLILDASLPFLNLVINRSRGSLELVSSFTGNKDDIIQITHFNSFLKFIAALLLFLEMANYEQVPILFVDNLQEYFPCNKDTFEAAMDKSILNKLFSTHKNINFQVTARIAQYLGFFIKKNRTKSNKAGPTSPIQIIYFTSEDLVHAADHQLWIRNAILPDELLTDVCNSYSVVEEIIFE